MSLEELEAYASKFREKGFSVKRFPSYLRLVKDHCEVHAAFEPSDRGPVAVLKVPVTRVSAVRAFPDRLLTYLNERNASPKGPGRFSVEGDCVWCSYEASFLGGSAPDLGTAASELVSQVERLGPKILNLK